MPVLAQIPSGHRPPRKFSCAGYYPLASTSCTSPRATHRCFKRCQYEDIWANFMKIKNSECFSRHPSYMPTLVLGKQMHAHLHVQYHEISPPPLPRMQVHSAEQVSRHGLPYLPRNKPLNLSTGVRLSSQRICRTSLPQTFHHTLRTPSKYGTSKYRTSIIHCHNRIRTYTARHNNSNTEVRLLYTSHQKRS